VIHGPITDHSGDPSQEFDFYTLMISSLCAIVMPDLPNPLIEGVYSCFFSTFDIIQVLCKTLFAER